MQKQISYGSSLSLKDIAIRRLVVNFWSEPDILSSIGMFQFMKVRYFERKSILLEILEKKVKTNIQNTLLPESLKKEIMLIVKPIGLQIVNWKTFHDKYLVASFGNFKTTLLEKLCWTIYGTLDYRKTAEEIIKCEKGCIVPCYKLACLYCLEDYIPELWEEIPEEIKLTFYYKNSPQIHPHLPDCWPHILNGEEPILYKTQESNAYNSPGRWLQNQASFNQHAFRYSSLAGNKIASEYFFNKLTREEKRASLIETASIVAYTRDIEIKFRDPDNFAMEKHTEVFCYLLTLLTDEQQTQILTSNPVSFLCFYLVWPWQSLFLETARRVWTFLPESQFIEVITKIIETINSLGYYFPQILQEFFIESPIDFRKCFVAEECSHGVFLPKFFKIQDLETIEVILRNLDIEDVRNLANSLKFPKNLKKMIFEQIEKLNPSRKVRKSEGNFCLETLPKT